MMDRTEYDIDTMWHGIDPNTGRSAYLSNPFPQTEEEKAEAREIDRAKKEQMAIEEGDQ